MSIASPTAQVARIARRAVPTPDVRTRQAWLMALIALLAWSLSVGTSTVLHVGGVWHQVALFLHLASLVAGLGSVLTIDFLAMQWMLGQRTLRSVVTFAAGTTPLVWAGFVGLVATGALLSPDLSSDLTRTKLLLVLLVGLNGAFAGVMQERLAAAGARVSRWLLAQGVLVAMISQVAWWGAVLVGFVNSQA